MKRRLLWLLLLVHFQPNSRSAEEKVKEERTTLNITMKKQTVTNEKKVKPKKEEEEHTAERKFNFRNSKKRDNED